MTEDEIKDEFEEWYCGYDREHDCEWFIENHCKSAWTKATELAEKRHAEEINHARETIIEKQKIIVDQQTEIARLQKSIDDILERHHRPL